MLRDFKLKELFSWLQRKFSRLVVRWERQPRCFSLLGCLFYVGAAIIGIGSQCAASSEAKFFD
jgi:hypothetical protein